MVCLWCASLLALPVSPLSTPASLFSSSEGRGYNVDRTDDWSHGGSNDWRGALKEVGLWAFVLLCIVSYNLPYGSTFSPSRLEQLQSACREYASTTNPYNCPLFTHWLPLILENRGMPPSDATNDGVVREIWESIGLSSMFSKKGDKTGLCRFFGYIYKAEREHRLRVPGGIAM